MKVTAVTRAGTPVSLTQEDQDDLARIFELGVNVPPNTRQATTVRIETPGYEVKEPRASGT